MIIDSLQHSALYEQVNPYFKEAFDYIKKLDFNNLAAGKTQVNGDALIVNINESQLKKKEDAKLEVHNRYIDIQIPLSCAEGFGWKYRPECTQPKSEFNEEKDILFFDDEPSTYFTLQSGEFVIFFPEDAHAPLVGEGEVKKIVVKVQA